MEEKIVTLFLRVRESFHDIKEKVSLIKPYFDLHCIANGWALPIEAFEKFLRFKPEFLYKSPEQVYAISVLYRVDDEVTTGIIAYEFAEIVAKEKNVNEYETVDRICVERGFGEQLLSALLNDILPGMVERDFIIRDDLEQRIKNLKKMLGES